MKTKALFLQAVQILAQGDPFILQAAERVREETLPRIPGGAALEFVAAMERFRIRLPHQAKVQKRKQRQRSEHQCKAVMVTSGEDLALQVTPIRHPIALSHALRVRSAEYWLKLGGTGAVVVGIGFPAGTGKEASLGKAGVGFDGMCHSGVVRNRGPSLVRRELIISEKGLD